ncbi:hypothetical protein F5882DRAFT_414277 [Hyaloscypha sp. PMI_1271]|nr:hypothetical protein F5882DRAFT_414277 [Hyaloscypha sp. PMI_1271]
MAFLLPIMHSIRAGFRAYNLFLIEISIQNPRPYEERAKQAVRYSNIAERQLNQTITTQVTAATTTPLFPSPPSKTVKRK